MNQSHDLNNVALGTLFTSNTPAIYSAGLTKTLELKTGSPAIDAGGLLCESTDQRGLLRPVNKVGGLFCDIGAFEVQ